MEREKLIRTVTAAQAGDSDALNALFSEFYNDVYYFALKTVKDGDLACDITQESFIEIINTIGDLQEPAAFVKWMKQITYHQCTRYFKKKKDVLVDEDEEGHTIFDTVQEERAEFIPDEAMDQQDFRKTILSMIDELSEEQRAATMMYYFDELSVKQIADIQGCSEGTVKSRLNYARKSIKNSVEDYEKKNGIKLHCAGILPLLLWLWNTSRETMSASAAGAVAQGVTAATGVTVTLSSGAAVTTAAAVGAGAAAAAGTGAAGAAAATGILAKIAALPVIVKAIAAIVAGAIAVGGVAVAANSGSDAIPSDPTTIPGTTASTEVFSPDTVPTTQPVTTPTTEPTTEPTDESTETDPSASEPTQSEPTETNPSIQLPVISPGTGDVIPEGCTYVLADGTVLNAGERMPGVCTLGDEFITQDYIYKFASSRVIFESTDLVQWAERPDISGWGATVRDINKVSYGELLSEVNGMPLLLANQTYGGCENMIIAPNLPASIIEMERTFAACTSLVSVPDLPDGVTSLYLTFDFCSALQEVSKLPANTKDMFSTFAWCESLVTAPEIPDGVETMVNTFTRCDSLKTAPVLPDSVTNMQGTFGGCESLTTVPNFPKNVTNMYGTFGSCTALTSVPASIPEGVTNMYCTFEHCQSLPVAPDIPGSVLNLEATFSYCYALQKMPTIASGPTELIGTFKACTSLTEATPLPESIVSLYETFMECSALIRAPEIPQSVTNMYRAFAYCESLTTATKIPSSVTNMFMTFYNCTSLSGIIEIDATPEEYSYCFEFTTLPIALTGSGQNLWTIAGTSFDGNVQVLKTDRPANSYYDYTSVLLVHGEVALRPYYLYYSTDSGYTQLNAEFYLVNGLDVAITVTSIASIEIFDVNGDLIATHSPGELPGSTVDGLDRLILGFGLSHSSLLIENADLTGITCKIRFTYQPVSNS